MESRAFNKVNQMISQIICPPSHLHPLQTTELDQLSAKMLCDYNNIHCVIRVIGHLLWTVDNYKAV